MISLLAKLFLKTDGKSESDLRKAYGILCGAVGIGLNILLFLLKFLAGTISGSIAITADAFNNLSDAGSSVVTTLGFQLAGQKPDSDHPFGHGRIEYLSGLAVSMLIFLMGFELAKSSFAKIRNPEPVEFSILVALILCASIAVKLYMSFYNRRLGKKLNSAAMLATAADSLSDSISTLAVLIATVVGAAAYKTRLCMAGGIRDGIMFKDFRLLFGFVAVFAIALIGNIVLGKFKLGFAGQPVAHSDHLWSCLGMALVGWGSVLLGGCPLRQLILAGSGNGDSAVTVFGMMAGAALAHNFGLAGSADSVSEAGEYIVGGIKTNGQVAVFIALAVLLIVSLVHLPKKAKN